MYNSDLPCNVKSNLGDVRDPAVSVVDGKDDFGVVGPHVGEGDALDGLVPHCRHRVAPLQHFLRHSEDRLDVAPRAWWVQNLDEVIDQLLIVSASTTGV